MSRAGGRSLALAAALLVGGLHAGGCVDNQGACASYVQDVNNKRTQCAPELPPLDEEEVCPASLNGLGADCTEYYANLADSVQCVNGDYVVTPLGGSPGCT